ncbi:MAG: hypothetical protein GAK28_03603 [Luteibacter sp.]|uniref:hypothetical protein n=1 Tax=Luteibacter sp. TaxID=1886636 RepID=UPI001380936A|nr:hypothetical protein [Luteibacter sp.]KAF1004976.1 MAG: hypothetical protein GAK28_03603 [Luteibacter sp.]
MRRSALRFLGIVVAPTLLAACAATSPPEVAVTRPTVAPIAVSCTTDAMTEEPCIAQARESCASPAVDTIHLVLATPVTLGVEQHTKASYQYRATYTCPHNVTALAPK